MPGAGDGHELSIAGLPNELGAVALGEGSALAEHDQGRAADRSPLLPIAARHQVSDALDHYRRVKPGTQAGGGRLESHCPRVGSSPWAAKNARAASGVANDAGHVATPGYVRRDRVEARRAVVHLVSPRPQPAPGLAQGAQPRPGARYWDPSIDRPARPAPPPARRLQPRHRRRTPPVRRRRVSLAVTVSTLIWRQHPVGRGQRVSGGLPLTGVPREPVQQKMGGPAPPKSRQASATPSQTYPIQVAMSSTLPPAPRARGQGSDGIIACTTTGLCIRWQAPCRVAFV